MNASPQRTIQPYSGNSKTALHAILESKQPIRVATANCARAIQVQAWLLGRKLSRRKQPCGAFLVFLP